MFRCDLGGFAYLSIFHGQDGGHSRDFELSSNVLVLIYVDCDQINFLSYEVWLCGHFVEGGGEKFAWLTPGCKEVDQDGCFGIRGGGREDASVECGGRDVFVHLANGWGGAKAACTACSGGTNQHCRMQYGLKSKRMGMGGMLG